ncbi:restriction endonuclease subunit S [Streptococcus suis]|uniref:Type I restriction-modification system, specificity determinant n=1 Tax=Streptococcus suis TaxID=1307 RepID=A0AAN2RFE7_STRSU|nr:restriction endonuclease subunit S [Streptococcus suis]NQH74732.1 restriction endonuclease subunit S [Streptococcus suis]NQR13964.1 restriction endonuclease subunit S [Streptococcus suis]CYU57948.1 type I restriction-modification system%2C specificity determinant [Streptococcus suis]HEM5642847.1 restriction endonuclease subunit S [Streptococcus suis]
MNYIEKMLQDYCPNGVEWKELGEVAEIKNGFAFKSSLYSEDGIRVIRISDVQKGTLSDKDIKFYPLEKKDEVQNYLLAENDLVMSLTGNVGRVAMVPKDILPAGLNQRVACIRPRETTLVRYLFHFLGQSCFELEAMQNATGGGQKNLSTTWLAKYEIPIPPLKIQEEIVALLDKFTEYVTELTAELTDRQKQYSFYRDKLLSFEDEVYQVEWKTLGELFEFKNGLNKGKEFFGRGTPIVNYTDVYKNIRLTSAVVRGTVEASPEEQKRYNVRRGDVFFTRTSETKEEIGKTSVLLEDIDGGVFSGFVLRARPKTDSLLPEYCAHCFNSSSFRKEIVRYSTYTTRALTNGSTLAKLTIPLPPLPIQERIVQVLDNFDAVCNDLNIGLPKEIELRQKQYEYFREKLLTFTAEGVYPGQWTVDSGQWTVSGDRPT